VFGAAAVVGFALFRMLKVRTPNVQAGSAGSGGFDVGRTNGLERDELMRLRRTKQFESREWSDGRDGR
jgi:hypothetical protein